jgi:hypothetical protein
MVIEWNPAAYRRTFGKFFDLPRKLPDPVPGTLFGHYHAAHPNTPRGDGDHRHAAAECRGYLHGYDKGFQDCFKLHVRIG